MTGHSRAGRRVVVGTVTLAVFAAPVVVPAIVEEQRARLPPPAHCDDPVAGEWRALRYSPRWRTWTLDTLHLRREPAGSTELVGTIEAESWTGGPTQTSPPLCRPGVKHWVVTQPATGTWDPGTRALSVRGQSWRVAALHCEPWASYAVDHFAGVVDVELEEFQSRNNDHRVAIEVPTRFRRVRYGGGGGGNVAPSRPLATDAPPDEPRRRGGCARR